MVGLKFILSLGLISLCGVARAEAVWRADTSAPQFCLQNFNAYGPIYASNVQERTERWTAELQIKPACEVVQLQEVWNEGHINQVDAALRSRYTMSSPNRKARIGLMSLFKGHIRSEETYSFKVNNEGGLLDGVRKMFNVKKAFHIVTADIPGAGEDFYFLNTHLHPSSQAVRLTQVLDLLNWRLKNQNRKLIVSGDFNASFDKLEHEFVLSTLMVKDSLQQVLGSYPADMCTYCHRNPLSWMNDDHVFDYVFYSNVGESATVLNPIDGRINMKGTERRPLSDHFGVRIQFSLVQPQTAMDFLTLELQKKKTVQVLLQASEVLKREKGNEFAPYKKQIKNLVTQLNENQGPFAEYFAKSF